MLQIAGLDPEAFMLPSWLNILCAVAAAACVDSCGRRPLLLASYAGMAASLMGMAGTCECFTYSIFADVRRPACCLVCYGQMESQQEAAGGSCDSISDTIGLHSLHLPGTDHALAQSS